MLNLLVLFSFFLINFNFFLSLQSESVVLFFSFFFIFFYILFHKKIDSLFFVEDEEISFLEELDWNIVINFFLKVKNWYRFFYRYIYLKLSSFYKFLLLLKKYIIYWFSSIYNLLVSHFYNLNINAVLNRLNVLEKYKKNSKYKNNPFAFLVL
jgi:hypothetical protein